MASLVKCRVAGTGNPAALYSPTQPQARKLDIDDSFGGHRQEEAGQRLQDKQWVTSNQLNLFEF